MLEGMGLHRLDQLQLSINAFSFLKTPYASLLLLFLECSLGTKDVTASDFFKFVILNISGAKESES